MHERNGAESIIRYVSKTVGRGVDNENYYIPPKAMLHVIHRFPELYMYKLNVRVYLRRPQK